MEGDIQGELQGDIPMDCIVQSHDPLLLVSHMDSYFNFALPDCHLYSRDNFQIPVHKELLYQTQFMREMIESVGVDSEIDLICPSMAKEDLEMVVHFLYNGKLLHASEEVVSNASKNLAELFGFPMDNMSLEKTDVVESIVLPEVSLSFYCVVKSVADYFFPKIQGVSI